MHTDDVVTALALFSASFAVSYLVVKAVKTIAGF